MTTPGPAASLPFDDRPLTEPLDRATVREYVRALKASGRMPSTSPVTVVVTAVVGVMFLLIFGSVFGSIFSSLLAFGRGGSPLFAIVPVIIAGVFLTIVGVSIWRVATGRFGSSGARAYRLEHFAKANGMAWYPEAQDPALPGLIFGLGHHRVATDIVRGTRPRLVEFANYRYKTGSGKNETTHTWGYVAIKLTSPLPNIVLDATGNNSFLGSNLPRSFDRSQRLSLEGDFDRHFALYCPQGYERDALYLFTPDIMARFVDHAAELDVEIVDDWLFLYGRRDIVTLDAPTWAWLFATVRALTDKFAQWERWRDDRLAEAPPRYGSTAADYAAAQPGVVPEPGQVPGPGQVPEPVEGSPLPFAAPTAALRPTPRGVAPQGRRLRPGVQWGAMILTGVFLLAWLFSQFGALQSIFGR